LVISAFLGVECIKISLEASPSRVEALKWCCLTKRLFFSRFTLMDALAIAAVHLLGPRETLRSDPLANICIGWCLGEVGDIVHTLIIWAKSYTLDRLIDKNRQLLHGKVRQPIARMMLPKPQVHRNQDHHHGRWGSGTHAQLQHLTKDNRRFS
jgi:hypothetical protein